MKDGGRDELIRLLWQVDHELAEGLSNSLPENEHGWVLRHRFENASRFLTQARSLLSSDRPAVAATALLSTLSFPVLQEFRDSLRETFEHGLVAEAHFFDLVNAAIAAKHGRGDEDARV